MESRLRILIAHILKWIYQTEQRSHSWRGSIVDQRQELAGLVERGGLRSHAEDVLSKVHHQAVERAVAETGLPASTFPTECPYALEQLLPAELLSN